MELVKNDRILEAVSAKDRANSENWKYFGIEIYFNDNPYNLNDYLLKKQFGLFVDEYVNKNVGTALVC